ncbi:MAG: DUF1761 domain-containing protein [Nanoarchaeota archaeon]
MPEFEINYLAVLVSAVAAFAIGALWYSVLFGKVWMKLSGMDKKKIEKEKKKGMAKSYVGGFIALLVMAFVLAHFVDMAKAASVLDGAQAGFWAWLGFVATVMLNKVLWEGKPFKLYLLDAAHYLVALLVMGSILAVWV